MPNEKKVKPMPGHDFEKKVQQQMEGFNVTPSRTVWNRVELEIRREKRRRRVLIALPILLLLVGGGIFLRSELNNDKLAIGTQKQKTESHDTKNTHPDPLITDVPQPGNSKQDPGKHDNLISPTDSDVATKSGNATTGKSTGDAPPATDNEDKAEVSSTDSRETGSDRRVANSKNPPATHIGGSKVPVSSIENKVTTTDKSTPVRKTKKEPGKSSGLVAAGAATQTKGTTNAKTRDTKEQQAVPDRALATTDDGAKQGRDAGEIGKAEETDPNKATKSEVAEIIEPVNPPMKDKVTAVALPNESKAAVASKKKAPANDAKWSWGITGGIGVSRITNGGLFDAFGGESKMMDAALFSGNTSFNPTPSGLPQQAAEIRPGMNYNAGVFIERSLTKKLSISAGLQYNYFSTYSDIGKRVDSQRYVSNSASQFLRVDNYYRNGQNNRYVSSYHFIELPITLNVRLGGNKKTSYYWNSGFSIGQLLATNALHYDGQSGFYYADNNLFRKMQWSLHTELAIRLFSDTKHALEIGPHFNYQPSNLLKQTTAEPQHLLSGGLKVRWYMGQLFK